MKHFYLKAIGLSLALLAFGWAVAYYGLYC